jgi:hypothetical protein
MLPYAPTIAGLGLINAGLLAEMVAAACAGACCCEGCHEPADRGNRVEEQACHAGLCQPHERPPTSTCRQWAHAGGH